MAADLAPKPAAGKLTPRNAFIAAGAVVILLAAGAGGYRLYLQHYADAAGEALRARAYAEVTAQQAGSIASGAKAREQAAQLAAVGEPMRRTAATAGFPQATPAPKSQPPTRAASKPKAATAKPPARVALRPASAASAPPPSRFGKARQATRSRANARAPAPVPVAMRPPLGVDALYQQRSRQLCESGLLGFICREVTKVQLCHQHNAYGKAAICPSRKPPLPIWFASIA